MSKEQLSRGRLRMRAEAVIYKLSGKRAEMEVEQILDEAFPMGYEAEAVTLINIVLHKKFGNRHKIKSNVADIMWYVERWRDVRNTSGLKPQQERPTVEASDEGTKYYQKAIEAGIIERDGDGYKRKGITKAQLAYFLQRVYTPDATGRDGRVFPETMLNELFKERRLGEAVRKLKDVKKMGGGGKPRGYQKIDILFESEQP